MAGELKDLVEKDIPTSGGVIVDAESLRIAIDLLKRAEAFVWRVDDLSDGDDEHAVKWLQDYKQAKGE